MMQYSPTDKFIMCVDDALGTIFGATKKAARDYPTPPPEFKAANADDGDLSGDLSDGEQQHAAADGVANAAADVANAADDGDLSGDLSDSEKQHAAVDGVVNAADDVADVADDGDLSGDLSDSEKQHAAALMRVNHAGEICAQALYQSQALTARSAALRNSMRQAALEENDHLAWCAQRIEELGGHKSYLNPLWYAGAFSVGTLAGLAGDKWNLGFVAETERQVVRHLATHLNALPAADARSRAIVIQMQLDEAEHATKAVAAGAKELPPPLKKIMAVAAKIMTMTAHRI